MVGVSLITISINKIVRWQRLCFRFELMVFPKYQRATRYNISNARKLLHNYFARSNGDMYFIACVQRLVRDKAFRLESCTYRRVYEVFKVLGCFWKKLSFLNVKEFQKGCFRLICSAEGRRRNVELPSSQFENDVDSERKPNSGEGRTQKPPRPRRPFPPPPAAAAHVTLRRRDPVPRPVPDRRVKFIR